MSGRTAAARKGPAPAEPLLSTRQVAELLGIHPQQVRELVARGELETVDMGTGKRARLRFRQSAVAALVEARTHRPRRRPA